MTLARPWLLLVGAACAAAVLLLHMLRHRPGPRRPLPTARFLAPDRRTRLRLHVPSHPALLAARVSVVAALALAAAGTTVPPSRDGAVRIVALDAGAGMGPVWEAALDSAEAALSGGSGARLVAFDTAPAPLASGALDSLRGAGPGTARADYRAAFGALRAAASASDGETFEAVLVTRPRAHAWGSGMAAARAAAWPAPIRVIAVAAPGDAPTAPGAASGTPGDAPGAPGEGGADSTPAPAGPRVRLHGRAAADPHLRAALASLGATAADAGSGVAGATDGQGPGGAPSGEGDGGPPLLLGDAPAADADAVLAAGGVVGSWGTAAPGRAGVWRAAAASDGGARRGSGTGPASASDGAGSLAPATAVLLALEASPDPVVVEAPLAVAPGAPDPDARVWAVAGDGRALGVAITAGEGGCASHFGGDLLAPRVVASPRFPDLVAALLDGCGAERFAAARPAAGRSPDVGALGAGATRVLSGADFPAASARSLGLTGGRSLVRPLLLLALALALFETALGAAAARRSVAVAAAPAPTGPGARAA